MVVNVNSKIVQLGSYKTQKGQSSVSGLSSGAFMTVQLHLAHSASFSGAGIIAGGPFRCAESYRGGAALAEDSYIENSLYICMNPLVPQTTPDAQRLADLANETAKASQIDAISNLAGDRVYIFTGSEDKVVYSDVVARTRLFYELLGVEPADIVYDDSVRQAIPSSPTTSKTRPWPPISRLISTMAVSCSPMTFCAISMVT